jgi:hypothetical protein
MRVGCARCSGRNMSHSSHRLFRQQIADLAKRIDRQQLVNPRAPKRPVRRFERAAHKAPKLVHR